RGLPGFLFCLVYASWRPRSESSAWSSGSTPGGGGPILFGFTPGDFVALGGAGRFSFAFAARALTFASRSFWSFFASVPSRRWRRRRAVSTRSEEHTSELQSRENLVCRLL